MKRLIFVFVLACLAAVTQPAAADVYSVDLPDTFVQEVENIFHVNQDGTPFDFDLISGENPNIHLYQEAVVRITFIHEAAAYKNQFGYFTYEDCDDDGFISDDEIISEEILFANVSEENDIVVTGDTVDVGPLPAGTNLGFFIIANGYQNPKGIYYSLSELNDDEANHFPMIATSDGTNVAIGIEDKPWEQSDQDCNDVIFTFTTTPEDAIVDIIDENEIPVNEEPIVDDDTGEEIDPPVAEDDNPNADAEPEEAFELITEDKMPSFQTTPVGPPLLFEGSGCQMNPAASGQGAGLWTSLFGLLPALRALFGIKRSK